MWAQIFSTCSLVILIKYHFLKKFIQLEDNCNIVLVPATYPHGSDICPRSLEPLSQLPSHPSRLSQGRKYHFKELLWEFKQVPEMSGKCLTIVVRTVSPSGWGDGIYHRECHFRHLRDGGAMVLIAVARKTCFVFSGLFRADLRSWYSST